MNVPRPPHNGKTLYQNGKRTVKCEKREVQLDSKESFNHDMFILSLGYQINYSKYSAFIDTFFNLNQRRFDSKSPTVHLT